MHGGVEILKIFLEYHSRFKDHGCSRHRGCTLEIVIDFGHILMDTHQALQSNQQKRIFIVERTAGSSFRGVPSEQ